MTCTSKRFATYGEGTDHLNVTQHEAGGLTYYEVLPEGVSPDAELPMVVFFHGRGDYPRPPKGAFLGLEAPVRLILPQAPTRLGKGFTWLPVSARNGESDALVRSLLRVSDHVAEFIQEVRWRHPTWGTPVVSGFSQGGMISFALGVYHPEVVGAAFPVAGWLPPSLRQGARWNGHPPIWAIHGTKDPILKYHRTENSVDEMRSRGFDVELESFPAEHRMTRPMRVQLRDWIEGVFRDWCDDLTPSKVAQQKSCERSLPSG